MTEQAHQINIGASQQSVFEALSTAPHAGIARRKLIEVRRLPPRDQPQAPSS